MVQPDELVNFVAASRTKNLAISFLKRYNKSRYGVLIDDLEN